MTDLGKGTILGNYLYSGLLLAGKSFCHFCQKLLPLLSFLVAKYFFVIYRIDIKIVIQIV